MRHTSSWDTGPPNSRNCFQPLTPNGTFQTRRVGHRAVRHSAKAEKQSPRYCAATVATAAAAMASGISAQELFSASGQRTPSPTMFAKPATRMV